ncbi:MAG: Ig-like domain-containing protein, partial [Actinocrinis sp.]
PTPTATKVTAPAHAQTGQNFLLSARVVLAKGPTAPVTDPPTNQQAKDGPGAGKGGKDGKGRGHRRPGETGEMTFVIDGKALDPVKVTHGRALEKLELPAGDHTAAASYGGDGNYSPSESAPVTFTVS